MARLSTGQCPNNPVKPKPMKLFLLIIFGSLVWGYSGHATQNISIRDGRGRHISLPHTPQRIVSSSLASDEILLEILAKDYHQIAALSEFSTNPAYSSIYMEVKKLGLRTLGSELESILSTRPEIVILASYNRPDFIHKLDSSGVKTFVMNKFESLADIKGNIYNLGVLLNKTQEANRLINRTFAKLNQISNPMKTFTVVSFSDNMILPATSTMFDAICQAAKVENIVAKKGLRGWVKVGSEALLSFNPDFVVVPIDPSEEIASAKRKIIDHPTFGKLNATKKNKFIFVPSAKLLSVSHHVIDAIKLINQGAYGS